MAPASPFAGLLADLRARRIRESHLGRLLRIATFAYLGLPIAMFAAGWLRWWASALVLGALAVAAVSGARGLAAAAASSDVAEERRIPIWHLVAAALPAALFVFYTGAFGDRWQTSDWLKHQAMLRELIEADWPVVFRTTHDPAMLVYYVAQYLPAGLVGKFAGWDAAHNALGLTIALGIALAASWVLRLTRAHGVLVGGAMLLFSGADVVGTRLAELLLGHPQASIVNSQYLDAWAVAWQYSGFATLIAWVPQHAVGGWLSTALLLDGIDDGGVERSFLFVVALAALWSPFAMLGLAPVILAVAFRPPVREFPARLRAALTAANAAGVPLLLVFGAYYAMRMAPLTLSDLPPISGGRPDGFMVYLQLYGWSVPRFSAYLLLFCLVEFAVLAAVVWAGLRAARPALRPILAACVILLAALPLFRYGQFNDLVMRVSIPALFVLAVAALTTLARPESGRRVRVAVAVLLLLGAPTGMIQVARFFRAARPEWNSFLQPPARNMGEAFTIIGVVGENPNNPVTRQYVGSTQSAFARVLARPQPHPVDRRRIVIPARHRANEARRPASPSPSVPPAGSLRPTTR